MNKPSNKSDHELVYMEINEQPAPIEGGWSLFKGGKRKSRKGRKSKKNKKSNRKQRKWQENPRKEERNK